MTLRADDSDTPARPGATARFALRAATATAHARLDRLYSTFDLSTAKSYGVFLNAHAAAFIPVEAALTAAGAGEVIADWEDRLRAQALRDDLAALGLVLPAPAGQPAFDGAAAILGGAYVLEGSRLGGALLRRAAGPGLPTAFLAPGNPAAWRTFISLLDLQLSSSAQLDAAAASAAAVFDLFERSAQTALEPARP